MDKQAVAQKIRALRSSYTVEERAPWDKKIHDAILPLCEDYEVIALYAAMNGEVDTYGIMESLFHDSSKVVCVPKVISKGVMAFYRIQSFKDLKPGVMGILEPTTLEEVQPQLVITPLSVFNDQGYRIGYGGGYYDAYFAKHECFRVGVAYHFQYQDIQFQESHDIACHMIVSDREVYYEENGESI